MKNLKKCSSTFGTVSKILVKIVRESEFEPVKIKLAKTWEKLFQAPLGSVSKNPIYLSQH